ncbi:U3 small nucleolar RNA-associated protein 7 [Plasmodium brasilianum]|uniref:U3 small nucleolar RNA-associated protein 7, putative n=2 Tax=Plasmodium (Plasmodium) TaxID=418103 RepID=A0A1D3JIW3_PLAMA|nr:U3 small nucleolar RNA-associated protein 7, putative [Plasmodium malariae]KAI4840767.1 U3 small nucleolar RNA-associated protein 7 [Plasmodium brasilianum]SBT86334.1 U3 small nucleolar RNA-associated protein 7, putative [Plasmodium malariae]
MEDIFVESNVNTEKIKENKITVVNVNKIIYNIKKRIKKKKKRNGGNKINYLPVVDPTQLPKDLPNTKNIKNKKLKNKLKKDVKLAILSTKKILANKKFRKIDEGYIDVKQKHLVQKKDDTEGVHPVLKGKKGKKGKEIRTKKGMDEIKQSGVDKIKQSGVDKIKRIVMEDLNKIEKGVGNIPETNATSQKEVRIMKFPAHVQNKMHFSMRDERSCYSGEYYKRTEEGEEGIKEEKKIHISQKYIYDRADIGTQKKVIDLSLNMGPYTCTYSRNGKYLLTTGDKGHITLIDTQNLETLCELEVCETVRCNTILHNHKLFAVSQKKYMYIYDNTGLEVNCIKDILYTYQMEFLPYHFLLTSVGEFGELVYQDITMGNIITRKKTKRGPCSIMKQNKHDAIIYLGHSNGHVTLWSPNVDKCICDIYCHYTPISSIAVSDNYLISASIDCTYKIWDMRKLEYIKSYREHNIINNIDISDTSIVAFCMNSHFKTYKNLFTKPEVYLTHNTYGDKINSISFQPFEDICCAGLKYSVKSFLVPGSGLANIDTFVNNPYETKKQVRENEVRLLLDKLSPDTIQFKRNEIGKVNPYQDVHQNSTQPGYQTNDRPNGHLTDRSSSYPTDRSNAHKTYISQRLTNKVKTPGKMRYGKIKTDDRDYISEGYHNADDINGSCGANAPSFGKKGLWKKAAKGKVVNGQTDAEKQKKRKKRRKKRRG